MAVEARNMNLLLHNSSTTDILLNPTYNQLNAVAGGTIYNSPQMRFIALPSPATLPENQSLLYQPPKTSVNTDSGVTYSNNVPAPRKRSGDCIDQFCAAAVPNFIVSQKNNISVQRFPSFVGEDIMPQIHQYQMEIETIISQHTKRIRLELEERQKQQARLLLASIGQGAMKKLKEKEEHIQKMCKFNAALQERVKSLYLENQLWRDLAHTNEATANSLRTNLQQVLLQVAVDEGPYARADGGAAVEEDVESCCGSSDDRGGVKECEGGSCWSNRRCTRCGERESCVLLLPCRHLCLCSICGSGSQRLQACPLCNSSMTATLHLNMSSSRSNFVC